MDGLKDEDQSSDLEEFGGQMAGGAEAVFYETGGEPAHRFEERADERRSRREWAAGALDEDSTVPELDAAAPGAETLTVWLWHDVETAFQWSRIRLGADLTPWRMSGVVMYGEITATRMRALRVSGEAGPCFLDVHLVSDSKPPTPAELAEFQLKWLQLDVRLEFLAAHRHSAVPAWSGRESDEDATAFLSRVAMAYMRLEPLRPTDTTTAFAEHAEVPFTTAVNWIRQCRDRNLLPRSRRQLAREKSADE